MHTISSYRGNRPTNKHKHTDRGDYNTLFRSLVSFLTNLLQNIAGEKASSSSVMASDFGTVDYYHKSNAKTAVVLDVLKLGYSVLIIDADVVLFKNPFPYFNCTSCDVHFQMDRDMYNR